MSDHVEQSEDAAPEKTADGPRGGERLAIARRELKISIHEIAKELHLDEPKVRALERNEFEVLGAPVFAKGHLRKYAELVNVKVEDVIGDYFEMTRTADMPPVVSTRPKPRRELSPGPWIALIVIIIVLATAYWWFTRPPAPQAVTTEPAPATSDPIDSPATDDAAIAEPTMTDIDPGSGEAQSVEQPVVEEPTREVTSTPAIAEGQMRMLLTYTGDCWTEVSDATGRRLFFNLGKDGRTVELNGAEPFNVLFGNPANVSVSVNGEAYALPPTTRPDRPLRLTISGS